MACFSRLTMQPGFLEENAIYCGDARDLLRDVRPESVALSFWSPPYFVGKSYERDMEYEDWQGLIREVVMLHHRILKPGGFLAINVADVLVFPDSDMPRIQADVVSNKRSTVTREQVLELQSRRPTFNRYQIAELLGCSQQTVDRRLANNNARGGRPPSKAESSW